ncbi:hypothetical protein LX16_1254 [Stackebrandtia albiflava]|uniref:Uncharacterized protein n=2 Tax=Stackebrandtia albiflava TaxID=406432 RepID=A0A562VCC5_9ACTN|nr:hypothetical protein LX16_1254 [Stackebrandtia albiflava]
MATGFLLLAALTACGGEPEPSEGSTGELADTPDNADEMALAFAECMREHGVDMPDPTFDEEGGADISLPDGVDDETLRAAEEACKEFLPHGGEPPKIDPEVLEALHEYARCMRENGVPDFPDPDENGGFALDGDEFPPDDPTIMAAEEVCRDLMPGTPGDGGPGAGE